MDLSARGVLLPEIWSFANKEYLLTLLCLEEQIGVVERSKRCCHTFVSKY